MVMLYNYYHITICLWFWLWNIENPEKIRYFYTYNDINVRILWNHYYETIIMKPLLWNHYYKNMLFLRYLFSYFYPICFHASWENLWGTNALLPLFLVILNPLTASVTTKYQNVMTKIVGNVNKVTLNHQDLLWLPSLYN